MKTTVLVLGRKSLSAEERILVREAFPGKPLSIVCAPMPKTQEEWKKLCESKGIPEDVKVIYPDPYPLYLSALREGYEHFALHYVVGWRLMRPPQFARITEEKNHAPHR